MKKLLLKKAKLLAVCILASVILTFVLSGMTWSTKSFSNILSYFGIALAFYGSFTASNMSNWFSVTKKNINERYSPEEGKEKERLINHKLLEGWFTIFAAGIIIVISIMIYKL